MLVSNVKKCLERSTREIHSVGTTYHDTNLLEITGNNEYKASDENPNTCADNTKHKTKIVCRIKLRDLNSDSNLNQKVKKRSKPKPLPSYMSPTRCTASKFHQSNDDTKLLNSNGKYIKSKIVEANNHIIDMITTVPIYRKARIAAYRLEMVKPPQCLKLI